MSTFLYHGTDSTGRRVKGFISADNARSARDELRRQGLCIQQIRERAEASSQLSWFGALRRRRFQSSLTELYRELATLLQASVPLLDALDSSLPQLPRGMQPALTALRNKIADGIGVAEAMESERWLFDEMTIGMVRVGENAGNLDEIMDQVATFREQSSQMQDRVLSAVAYPTIVFFISVAVSLFLMTIVVPMLLDNLTELGTELPWSTQLLKWMSDTLLAHGWWLALVLTVGVALLGIWSRSMHGRRVIGMVSLRIPLLNHLIRKQSLGRSSLVIACLLRSGIELVHALRIAAQSCSHLTFREAYCSIASDLEKGQGLRESILRQSAIPASIAQVYALGQQSGQLESMLQRLGTDYERQSTILAARVTTVAEPILIVILSVIVGFIMFATVMPIMEAGNIVGK